MSISIDCTFEADHCGDENAGHQSRSFNSVGAAVDWLTSNQHRICEARIPDNTVYDEVPPGTQGDVSLTAGYNCKVRTLPGGGYAMGEVLKDG